MNSIAVIIQKIRQAFEDVPYPGDDCLVDPPKGYENRDYPEIAEAFRGKSWQSLSDDFLIEEYEAIFLLSPQGLHYFLPAYLISGLSESNVLLETLVSFLKPNLKEDLNDYLMERARLFTPAQKKVIGMVLEYIHEEDKDYWEGDPPDIRDAIRFWSGN
jgi:hypothetical protein